MTVTVAGDNAEYKRSGKPIQQLLNIHRIRSILRYQRREIQKPYRIRMIRFLDSHPVRHEEITISIVNHRIPNVQKLQKLPCSGAILEYRVRGKIPFLPLTSDKKSSTRRTTQFMKDFICMKLLQWLDYVNRIQVKYTSK